MRKRGLDDEQQTRTLKELCLRLGVDAVVSAVAEKYHADVDCIQNARTIVDVLPYDLLTHVLGKYGFHDAAYIARTCKAFYAVTKRQSFWSNAISKCFMEALSLSNVPPRHACILVPDFDPFVMFKVLEPRTMQEALGWIFDLDKLIVASDVDAATLPRTSWDVVLSVSNNRSLHFEWKRLDQFPYYDYLVSYGLVRLRNDHAKYPKSNIYHRKVIRQQGQVVDKEFVFAPRDDDKMDVHFLVLRDLALKRTFYGRGIVVNRCVIQDENFGCWKQDEEILEK